MHARYGSAFIIVTPVENQVFVADAKAADDILIRRKDFSKKPAVYAPFDIFGRNVNSVEGEAWQRHRKITTPPFNERNSSLVWTESLQQAKEMLRVWLSKGENGTTGTADDTMLLALHVLTGAGFGMSYSFERELTTPAAGHKMSYRDALRTLLAHVFITIMIGSAKLPSWLLPRKVAVVGEAMKEFKQYMVEMVDKERAAHTRGDAAGANLMSSLVRASEEADRAEEKGVQSKGGLTDAEIYGNLFIYNVAGHETTANILAYAVALLACYPQWQDWLGEEIDRVFVSETDANDAEQYSKVFPQLKRCLALMVSLDFASPIYFTSEADRVHKYETLRLYAPLNGIPRCTVDYQALRVDDKDYTIPPRTAVFVNNAALQCRQEYWGRDALVWRPDRWITDEGTSETFFHPIEGAYVPWAHGPRVCPGKKFSQVEFVAVIAYLLKDHRVRPVLMTGESQNDAFERMLQVVKDSDMEIAIKMNHPEKLRVRWERKQRV